MCHARVSEPRRAGSNIKVLNDDSIDDALDPSTSLSPVRDRGDTPDVQGEDVTGDVCKTEPETYLGGGSLVLGSGRSPVSEGGGN
jgi:hypothetical protein